jgi:uncharacterized protein (TIGR00297 family)
MQIALGFLLGVVVSFAAYRAGALSASGAVAASLVGGVIFGFGGIPWATLLLVFFVSSSLLSRAYKRQKSTLKEKFSKGSRRDHAQVLANGGLGSLLVLIHWFAPDQIGLWIAFVGSMAAVNADTWGTELGVLSASPPRLVTSGRKVERGVSGGVTFLGYLASIGGALIIGLCAMLFTPEALVVVVAVLGGLVGATVDSILGATVQGIFYCSNCGKETESHPLHHCGTETTYLRGWRWLNNDLVNWICSIVGAGIAVGGWFLIA